MHLRCVVLTMGSTTPYSLAATGLRSCLQIVNKIPFHSTQLADLQTRVVANGACQPHISCPDSARSRMGVFHVLDYHNAQLDWSGAPIVFGNLKGVNLPVAIDGTSETGRLPAYLHEERDL